MYQLISKLVVYKNLGENCLLEKLADVIKDFDNLSERPEGINHIEKETSYRGFIPL
jgi:hypothetical protein